MEMGHGVKEKEKKKNYPINRKRANSQSNLILTDYLKEALIGLTLGDIYLPYGQNKQLKIVT